MCVAAEDPQPINQFAVVCYIPDRLGDFITKLRQELVCGCTAQSHVTILPPRALDAPSDKAEAQLREKMNGFGTFQMEIPRIRVFEETSVIFADVGLGRVELSEMHDALNTGLLYYKEPYKYHPHITLAQNFDPATVREVYEMALRRWKEAPQGSVPIENVTFVQNTQNQGWIDLAEYELRAAMASR